MYAAQMLDQCIWAAYMGSTNASSSASNTPLPTSVATSATCSSSRTCVSRSATGSPASSRCPTSTSPIGPAAATGTVIVTLYVASTVPPAIGMRLIASTSGRSAVLANSTTPVSSVASAIISDPAIDPTAAEHHKVAAVLSPRTFIPSFMITPAPRKPIPDTT
jgi:hypothetical protein